MSRVIEGGTPVNLTDSAACRFVRRWVHTYTAPLSSDSRDSRRAEIESDLWEHVTDARANHTATSTAQLAVLARMITGVPSDLIWFSRMRRNLKENRSMRQRRLRTIALVCLAIVISNFVIANFVIKNPRELATIWWVLGVPIGFLLVGTIGTVATALLIREGRSGR